MDIEMLKCISTIPDIDKELCDFMFSIWILKNDYAKISFADFSEHNLKFMVFVILYHSFTYSTFGDKIVIANKDVKLPSFFFVKNLMKDTTQIYRTAEVKIRNPKKLDSTIVGTAQQIWALEEFLYDVTFERKIFLPLNDIICENCGYIKSSKTYFCGEQIKLCDRCKNYIESVEGKKVCQDILTDFKTKKNIVGPVSYKELSKGDTTILLFGDRHVKESVCSNKNFQIYIWEWVSKHVFSNEGKNYDIFVEEEYRTKEYRNYGVKDCFIKDFGEYFDGCFKRSKNPSECPYPNAKFHYTNIRLLPDWSKWILGIEETMSRNSKKFLRYDNDGVQMRTIVKKIKALTLLECIKDFKIDKQFKETWLTPDEEKEITSYFMTRLRKPDLDVVNKIGKSGLPQDKKDEHIHEILQVNFLILLMDWYTIGRMFRKFYNKKGKLEPMSKNMIVYEGQTHINNIVFILEKILGYTTKKSITSVDVGKSFQCIEE